MILKVLRNTYESSRTHPEPYRRVEALVISPPELCEEGGRPNGGAPVMMWTSSSLKRSFCKEQSVVFFIIVGM